MKPAIYAVLWIPALAALTAFGCAAGSDSSDRGDEESVETNESKLTFDPCSCLDASQIVDCRNGCVTLCKTSSYSYNWCETYYTYIACPDYVPCSSCGPYGC